MKMEAWCGLSSNGFFYVRIRDLLAGSEFVEIKITPENFALMLSNRPVECEGEVYNLGRVGKTKLREERRAIYNGTYNKETMREFLKILHKDDGWEMNDTLSSQNSIGFNHSESHYILNYSVEKWV